MGHLPKTMEMAKSRMRAKGQVPGVQEWKGRRAGRGGVPQFMIAPCQSVNERSLLLFIEITLAIDGGAGAEPLLIASPDLACLFIYILIFCSPHSCQATIINASL